MPPALIRCPGCGIFRKASEFGKNHARPYCRVCSRKHKLGDPLNTKHGARHRARERAKTERIQRMAVTEKRVADGETPTGECPECGWTLFPDDETCPDCGAEVVGFLPEPSDDFPMSLEYSGAYGLDPTGES
jgi:rubredoxin